MEYEKEYHKELHNSLVNNPELYLIRVKIAFNDYFGKIPPEQFRKKKILEYGCGLGQNILILTRKNGYFNTFGYDISKFAVDFCNKQTINATTNWNKIPKVDIIFSKFVLEHVTNPYDELKKMRDKLNDNGLLILILAREKYTKVPLTPDVNRHLWCWNFQAINNLLYETGFKVVKNEMKYDRGGFTKLWKPLYQVADSELLYTIGTKLVGIFTDSKEIRIYARKR